MTSIRSIRKRGQRRIANMIEFRMWVRSLLGRSIEEAYAAKWNRMVEQYRELPRYVVACTIDDRSGGVRW